MVNDFNNYFKIADTVFVIGNNALLRMNVTLNYTDIKGELRSFHQEYTTFDRNHCKHTSIQRSFSHYLSIENIKPNPNVKEFVMLGASELYRLRQTIPMIMDWFTNPNYAGLFALNQNKELYVDKQVDMVMISLPMNKFLSFEPVAINYDVSNAPGVRMYLASEDNYIDIPYESRFIGFADIIMHFDLYLAAQNLLNYLGRPAFGTNLHDFTVLA